MSIEQDMHETEEDYRERVSIIYSLKKKRIVQIDDKQYEKMLLKSK